jgi:hypothetical protein
VENALSAGMGLQRDAEDGKLYAIMQFDIGKIGSAVYRITNEDNYEQDIASLIGGLMQLRADFREQASGLITVKGVNDAAIRNPQGGKQRSPRGKGQAGT